jgi:5'-3' exonuclease
MLTDLIIDGNYILSKNTFSLHKNNLLYGALFKSLENSINNYKKLYSFTNVYLVSDSKEKSWRKEYIDCYKGTRQKNTDIDWEFVYQTYSEFKASICNNIKILEYPHIEGDDWISYLVNNANKEGRSSVIISNDYDIKQLIKYGLDPLYINIMINEMYNKEKIFLPINYQIFMNKLSKLLDNNDIFNLNDNTDFLLLIQDFINKYEVNEIDSIETLIVKIISGDASDNIGNVWSQTKNGKKRGIGTKGAQFIYNKYLEDFGDINLDDPDLYENIADLICEKKKLSKTEIDPIVNNIKNNVKLIDLRLQNLPTEIINKMEYIYKSLK